MMVKKMSRDKLAGDDEENRRDDVRRLNKNPPKSEYVKRNFRLFYSNKKVKSQISTVSL